MLFVDHNKSRFTSFRSSSTRAKNGKGYESMTAVGVHRCEAVTSTHKSSSSGREKLAHDSTVFTVYFSLGAWQDG